MTDKNGLVYQICTKVSNLGFGMIGNLVKEGLTFLRIRTIFWKL